MPEHIWKEHRHGVRCEECGAVSREAHQLWPCEGNYSELPNSSNTSEKDRRIYYQDLVYEICRLIDVANGNMPGEGIVCGTVEEPSTQLQQAVTVLIQKSLKTSDQCRLSSAEIELLKAAKIINCEPNQVAAFAQGIIDDYQTIKVLWDAIDRLRANEGASVEILCDNPDFNGQPNCAIQVSDDWTGTDWNFRRFEGDTLAECFAKAEEAKAAAEKRCKATAAPPKCETCGDTGHTMLMVCYGGVPHEAMQTCPDCNRTAEKGSQRQ